MRVRHFFRRSRYSVSGDSFSSLDSLAIGRPGPPALISNINSFEGSFTHWHLPLDLSVSASHRRTRSGSVLRHDLLRESQPSPEVGNGIQAQSL